MASKSEQAYRLIRDQIARHEIKPGDRLVLAQLAADLEMSVVPVREAIRRLEAERIVVFERNVGARVALVDREEYLAVMQTLAIVEGAATALAAPHMTLARLREARALNQRIKDRLASFSSIEHADLNREFHSLLTIDCPNEMLMGVVEEAWSKLGLVRDPAAVFTESRARESVAEHERIIALIEQGAASVEIETAVREHRLATQKSALGQQ